MTKKIEELIKKAIKLRNQENFNEALELAEELFKNNSDSKQVKSVLLDTLFAYGGYLNDEFTLEYKKAKNIFKRILEIDPSNYRAYYNLGIANFNLSKNQKAMACFEEAIKIKPDYKYCLYNIGMIYESEGNFQEALKHYEKALDIDPRFPYAFTARNQILENLDDLRKSNINIEQHKKVEKLKSLLEVSKRIRIEMIQSLLDINNEKLLDILIEWCRKYQFEIDGDFLNLNKETLPDLIKFLDDW